MRHSKHYANTPSATIQVRNTAPDLVEVFLVYRDGDVRYARVAPKRGDLGPHMLRRYACKVAQREEILAEVL